jgi:hypothetical protein
MDLMIKTRYSEDCFTPSLDLITVTICVASNIGTKHLIPDLVTIYDLLMAGF